MNGLGLKIRRYLVPWGFDSPSRHQRQLLRSGFRLRAPASPPRHAKSARAGGPGFAHARKAAQL
jgi:hypothetical protein